MARPTGTRRLQVALAVTVALTVALLAETPGSVTGAGAAPGHDAARLVLGAPRKGLAAPLPQRPRAAVPRRVNPVGRTATGSRPNVMVVMLDDMRADELEYLPNVRRYVRDRGLRFANAFSPYPLCCPARASFLLGQYAHNHHVLYHDAGYGFGSLDDHRTLATALQKSGYRTAMVGKYLNQYGIQPSRVTGGSSIHYVPAGWTDWMAGLDTIWAPGSGVGGNTYNYFDFTQNINGEVVQHPGQYSSTVVANEVDDVVGRYGSSTPEKPWFLWVTPVAPHHGGPVESDDPLPYVEANGRVQEFATTARPGWVKGRFDATLTHAPGTRVHGPSEADVSDKPRNIAKFLETTPEENARVLIIERQRAEALYAFDVEFGRMVTRLKATHQLKKTLIMFTSDNGYYTGEHRQREGKVKPHEPVIRVPLLVAGPGVPHGVRQTPVTTFDLTATILDVAGATLPGLDGESKADVIYGPDRGWTYPMLTEGLIPTVHRTQRGFGSGLTEIGVRTGRYKLVRYANGEQELYDLLHDPLELTSKIGDPAYAAVQRDLTALWWSTKDCMLAACRKPLDPAYVVSPRQLAHEVGVARRAAKAYYDN